MSNQSEVQDLEHGASHYWDRWHEEAVAIGVEPHVAQMARALMRDHYQHGYADHLLGEEADGPYMMQMALQAPLRAELRFGGDLATHAGVADDGEAVVADAMAARLSVSVDEVYEQAREQVVAAGLPW